MTQKTFKKNFSVKVMKSKKHEKPYDYLKTIWLEVEDNKTGEKGIYIWHGSYAYIHSGELDMNYLEYLMSRGMGGGPDFVDIVEEYVMNNLM
jgi:hypothetical protein